MGRVLGANVGQRADHSGFIFDHRLEHKALSAFLEDYPGVTVVFLTTALEPLADEELCVVAKFDQFPPCPKGMVLAVSLAKIFERSRMLPEVGFIEQFVIRQVLTLGEPAAHIIHSAHLHRALPFEIPAKHTRGTGAEDLRCDEQARHRLPWITDRDVPNQEPTQRAK